MRLRVTNKGNFNKTEDFINRVLRGDIWKELDRFGQLGVQALSSATPQDTGESAESWSYRVFTGKNPGIAWYNTHEDEAGTPVVILIEYGHATGTGGYVQGREFIEPALRSVFDQIADDIWKKVTQ